MDSVTPAGWVRWRGQFDALKDEVLGLHHSRRVWRVVRAMIETNPQVKRSGIAEHWLTQCYSVAQLAGVRRQVDQRRDVVSLWRLLDGLARQPAMATRSWFTAQLQSRSESAPYATSLATEFDEFAGAGSSTVDKRVAEADRDHLWTVTEAAKSVVDQFVAHQADAAHPEFRGPAFKRKFATNLTPRLNNPQGLDRSRPENLLARTNLCSRMFISLYVNLKDRPYGVGDRWVDGWCGPHVAVVFLESNRFCG